MITEKYEAALFNRKPSIGEINPDGEISYAGYSRVMTEFKNGTNIEKVLFPKSEQDAPVFASHVVILDGSGCVVGVMGLGLQNILSP